MYILNYQTQDANGALTLNESIELKTKVMCIQAALELAKNIPNLDWWIEYRI